MQETVRDPGFDPWVGKFSWKRTWQATLVFLPGEFHGQRNLMDYSPQGNTESDTTEATYHAAHILTFSGPKIKQSMVLINMNFLYSVYKTT